MRVNRLSLVVSVWKVKPSGLADGPGHFIRLILQIFFTVCAGAVHVSKVPIDEH